MRINVCLIFVCARSQVIFISTPSPFMSREIYQFLSIFLSFRQTVSCDSHKGCERVTKWLIQRWAGDRKLSTHGEIAHFPPSCLVFQMVKTRKFFSMICERVMIIVLQCLERFLCCQIYRDHSRPYSIHINYSPTTPFSTFQVGDKPLRNGKSSRKGTTHLRKDLLVSFYL